jgi:hypothetical protein
MASAPYDPHFTEGEAISHTGYTSYCGEAVSYMRYTFSAGEADGLTEHTTYWG